MPKTLVVAEPPVVPSAVHAELFDDPYSPKDPYIGTTLKDRFRVESKLGEGGFGVVYKGFQLGTNRVVAIKLLHPEMTRDKNVVQRFRLEGQVLCSLKDAHTVTTYDFDQTDDGTLFIAMELLEGRSLQDVFSSESPIAWQRMLKILAEMSSSLAEAHSKGIVHRDLKPENVHLEKRSGNDEFVKILDFGISKVLRGDGIGGTNGPQLTATGQTLGTLEYMSPEQLMGKQLDGRSDVYGMGVLAYELMTGRLPFPDAVGPAMLISAQLKRIPDAPSTALPSGGFPRDVDSMIFRMLEKDRNNRFPDVSALREECLRILSVEGQVSGLLPLPGSPGSAHPSGAGPGQGYPQVQQAPYYPAPNPTGLPYYNPVTAPGPSTQAIIAATAPTRGWIWLLLLALALGGGGVALALLN